MMVRLIKIIIISSFIIHNIVCFEKIPFINYQAWQKLTDKQQFELCNNLINSYNNTIQQYIKIKEKNIELENKFKNIRKNVFSFNIGYGLDLNLNNNLLINIQYSRTFLNLFALNVGLGSNIKINSLLNTSFFVVIGAGVCF